MQRSSQQAWGEHDEQLAQSWVGREAYGNMGLGANPAVFVCGV